MATLGITQRRSANGANRRQADTLRSLGLRRIGHTVQASDTPQIRGMIRAVRHLVAVEEPGAGSASSGPAGSAKPTAGSASPQASSGARSGSGEAGA
jgi:large subunit ribosomal protein L30